MPIEPITFHMQEISILLLTRPQFSLVRSSEQIVSMLQTCSFPVHENFLRDYFLRPKKNQYDLS